MKAKTFQYKFPKYEGSSYQTISKEELKEHIGIITRVKKELDTYLKELQEEFKSRKE